MQSIDLTEAVGSNAKEIDLIVSDIRLGGEAWLRAGERLVKLHRIDPGVIDKIATKHPELSHEILVNFLRIGRHEVYPPLLAAANKPGVSKLLDMPYEVQKRYAHEPIEIAVEWGKGKPKTIKKSVSLLTPREAGMVFAETGVRTIEQQAFRLRESVAPKPQCEGKNVDIGYFSLSADKDGKVTLTPCAKSSIAQPVRVIDNGTGWKSASWRAVKDTVNCPVVRAGWLLFMPSPPHHILRNERVEFSASRHCQDFLPIHHPSSRLVGLPH